MSENPYIVDEPAPEAPGTDKKNLFIMLGLVILVAVIWPKPWLYPHPSEVFTSTVLSGYEEELLAPNLDEKRNFKPRETRADELPGKVLAFQPAAWTKGSNPRLLTRWEDVSRSYRAVKAEEVEAVAFCRPTSGGQLKFHFFDVKSGDYVGTQSVTIPKARVTGKDGWAHIDWGGAEREIGWRMDSMFEKVSFK